MVKPSIEDKDKSRLVVVDPATGKQFDEHVFEVNVEDSWIQAFATMKVWDVDEEKEVEVIARERDQRYVGPGARYITKLYRRYCDFDVVDRESGVVLAEARYMNVTSRI